MAILPATSRQVPEHAIMDMFGKQPYLGNQFMASSNSISISGTSEVPVMYLACPSAATQAVGASQNAKSLFCNLKGLYCGDQSEATGLIYRIYFGSVYTSGGTAVTPVDMRPANPLVSVAVVYVSPSVSSKGTFVYGHSVGFESPSVSRELVILDPGMNMLITAQPSASSTGTINLSWYEI